MASSEVLTPQRGFGETERRDLWWLQPLFTTLGLSLFVVYATWAAYQGTHYLYGPYLSPFYSPLLFGESSHSWLGARPNWIPSWVSPALLILWAPAGFRLTCYYYRGAYYKSFWADPLSCTVGEPRHSYRGEEFIPLILQNIHRYFLYIALPFLLVLAYDVWKAMWFPNANGGVSFGIGIGTLVLAINVILLGGYTFGCHSLRHLIGGSKDEISKSPVCHLAYNCVSRFNKKHMMWAWMSLFWVMFSDLYVRLCSMGIWSDWRFF